MSAIRIKVCPAEQKGYYFRMRRLTKLINRGAPYVLFLYLLIGILAYVNIWPGSTRFFYSSSTSGVVVRALSTALICGYCVALCIVNRNRIRFPFRWLIAIGVVLIANFIVMMVGNHDYSYFYISSLYSRLHEVVVSTGYKTLVTMYLSSISDFALGFCFLFVLPFAFKEKKQLLILAIPMILFMIYECGYSVLKEYVEYQGIFSGETEIYGGYNISIGATFGDKQEFGNFLTIGFCCALVSFFCAETFNKKPLRIAMRIGCGGSALLFFGITFFTLCKTAIISNLFALGCVLIVAFVFAFKKSKVLFFSLLGMLTAFAIAITLILTIDTLHSSGVLDKFYKLVNTLFFAKINGGIFSRFYLVEAFFRKLDLSSFLFGFSKGGINGYMRAMTVEGQSGLHTGFIYFQACYGLLGSVLYFVFFAMVLRNTVMLCRKNIAMGMAILGCFICSCVFNLSECEVLIVSGSAAIFMFNVICVTFAKGLLNNESSTAK